MFYKEELGADLRFGDVIRGIIIAEAKIEDAGIHENFKIDISIPTFCAVLSPCCSIGNSTISVSPLIKVAGSFFDNEYFIQDLTNINRKMKPEQAVSRFIWEERLSVEERERRIAKGEAYAFMELFIYERNDLFQSYNIDRRNGNIKTNYYMIDFKNIYKLSCDKIISAENSLGGAKCLELSIETREELRNKMSFYFGRPALEDLE